MNRKRLIIIVITILIVITAAVILFLFTRGSSNEPSVSVAKEGQTVTPSTVPVNPSTNPGTATQDSSQQPTITATPPSTAEFSSQIQKATSYYTNATTGQPNFGITSVKNPIPGWFIVKVTPYDANQQPNKYIFQQTNDPNNPLTIVAGPATSFPPELVSLPDEVRKAL